VQSEKDAASVSGEKGAAISISARVLIQREEERLWNAGFKVLTTVIIMSSLPSGKTPCSPSTTDVSEEYITIFRVDE
jgi:hypothetical protein